MHSIKSSTFSVSKKIHINTGRIPLVEARQMNVVYNRLRNFIHFHGLHFTIITFHIADPSKEQRKIIQCQLSNTLKSNTGLCCYSVI